MGLSATTVQTDNGSEFIGSVRKVRGAPTLFEQTVEHYTGQRPVTIFPGAKTSQSDVEAFHRLVEDEFLAVEGHQRAAVAEAFTLPPIVLDDLEPLLPTPGYHVPVMASVNGRRV